MAFQLFRGLRVRCTRIGVQQGSQGGNASHRKLRWSVQHHVLIFFGDIFFFKKKRSRFSEFLLFVYVQFRNLNFRTSVSSPVYQPSVFQVSPPTLDFSYLRAQVKDGAFGRNEFLRQKRLRLAGDVLIRPAVLEGWYPSSKHW